MEKVNGPNFKLSRSWTYLAKMCPLLKLRVSGWNLQFRDIVHSCVFQEEVFVSTPPKVCPETRWFSWPGFLLVGLKLYCFLRFKVNHFFLFSPIQNRLFSPCFQYSRPCHPDQHEKCKLDFPSICPILADDAHILLNSHCSLREWYT